MEPLGAHGCTRCGWVRRTTAAFEGMPDYERPGVLTQLGSVLLQSVCPRSNYSRIPAIIAYAIVGSSNVLCEITNSPWLVFLQHLSLSLKCLHAYPSIPWLLEAWHHWRQQPSAAILSSTLLHTDIHPFDIMQHMGWAA